MREGENLNTWGLVMVIRIAIVIAPVMVMVRVKEGVVGRSRSGSGE